MRKAIYALLTMAIATSLWSCTDENIGGSISDTYSAVIVDSSFTITGHSVLNQRLESRSSTKLIGSLACEGYGTLTSEVVTQMMPAISIDTAGTKLDWIDSCRLTLRIAEQGFTGDSLVPMRMNVYQLNKQLPEPIYSDFSPEGYYDPTDLLGSASYSASSAKIASTVTYSNTSSSYYYYNYPYTSSTVTYYREVYVPMPLSLAKNMFSLYLSNPEVFNDPELFAQHFPGIYIANSYGKGRVMNFYNAEFEVFYRKHVQLTDTTDTIYPAAVMSYMASTPEVISNNNIKFDIAQSVKNMVTDGEAIVMGPAGYEVEVEFPIEQIIATYNKNKENDLSVINKLEMEIPADLVTNTYDIAPPKYLLMVKRDKKNEFFAGDSLTNNKDSFYATYNSAKRVYQFSGMRDYILNILNEQGGLVAEEDRYFTITPVDVSTYTTQATYYSSSRTVTTSIAPMISLPSIAKLRLDKAKIKITYSKQSMY